MPSISDTAYPRFKTKINQKELEEIYTPNVAEIKMAIRNTRGITARFCFLIMLKTFQRLGYFVQIVNVPEQVISYISNNLDIPKVPDLSNYGLSGTRIRHMDIIREFMNVTPYGEESRNIVVESVLKAAKTKEDLADIINVAIEELVRQRHELPAFSTLLRLAYEGRSKINENLYMEINKSLDDQSRYRIDRLFLVESDENKSLWNRLKNDIGKLTIDSLGNHIKHVNWLQKIVIKMNFLENIPEVKVKQFAAEAKSLNASRMLELKIYKRYALATTLISTQTAIAIDDLGDMLIKMVTKSHRKAQSALKIKQEKKQAQTDILIETLHQILITKHEVKSQLELGVAINNILNGRENNLLMACESHAIYAGNNYYPFLWKYHSARRKPLINILDLVEFVSTTQDESLIEAITFIYYHRKSRKKTIFIFDTPNHINQNSFDLSWIPERWDRIVFNKRDSNKKINRTEVNRKGFELCVFYHLKEGLKSGDICIVNSDKFSDYRSQLIDWDDYHKLIDEYSEVVNLPLKKDFFIEYLNKWTENLSKKVDKSFPQNDYVRLEQGVPTVKKIQKRKDPQHLKELNTIIADRLKHVNILEILHYTLKWVEWDKCFGPLSGFDSKLQDPLLNYLITIFCYGCNLGPKQTAQSVKGVNRFNIAWINQRHVTEAKLNDAIVRLINAYNKFELPKYWGSGESASVDGTKWELYEQNLMAEYHIRYGGYGGIGYYHVSDTYIALFSHFIPCGVYEAIYVLDGLLKNVSDIQPDKVHGDTHSQNESAFGLSYLLGIKLMPRIRNWKRLTFYKSNRNIYYKHIDPLFTDHINWNLIKKYLPDMIRVAISIKVGKIAASAILRRLGTYSKKNKLYQAFRELGRVVRTGFLLEYLNNKEIREIIHAATCKSETFNTFAQWLFFGGEGIMKENNRDEQRKKIKYNHFVANALSLYNVYNITCILNELNREKFPLTPELISSLSPYITSHVKRFGDYRLLFEPEIPKLEYNLSSLQ